MGPHAPLAWLLAIANFVVGMGAFVGIGILSPVAQNLSVPPSQAGWIMSAYALVYALSSPLLVAATGRVERATMLAWGMGLFALGAALAAFSPNLPTLLAARAVMALGGGLITPIALALAIALATEAQRGKMLALVFGGLSMSQALGVPTGAWLAYAAGWRWVFAVVAVASLGVGLWLWRKVPRALDVPVNTLASLGQVLGQPKLLVALAFTPLFICGIHTCFTYVGPYLESHFHLGRDGVTGVLLLAGLGAVVGNQMGGALNDRLGCTRTLALLGGAQLIFLPVLTLAGLPWWATALWVGLWASGGWAMPVPQQARLARLSPAYAPVLMSLNAAAIYVGSAVGATVGGQVLQGPGFEAMGPVGAGFIVLALISLSVVARWPAPSPEASEAALPS